ncbi:hypothetical protein BRADI_4g35206v3 [Brachypodium distachyon]|uniref:Uncharacterized protein n=1 Tax=Brachypodium distachyon TaxID=15368 RepID=A0A2K2CSD3_BRADI|nr:hypothetical protein BRADI_4g35206v3 [Brachypodium distachyon]
MDKLTEFLEPSRRTYDKEKSIFFVPQLVKNTLKTQQSHTFSTGISQVTQENQQRMPPSTAN